MYVNGEEVFLPRIRTRHVSQSNPERELFGFTPTNSADYRAGGYVVTQPMRRPAHIAADVFPDVLASPATCDNVVTLDTLWSISPRLWAHYGVPSEGSEAIPGR